jgi:hypothetical protein
VHNFSPRSYDASVMTGPYVGKKEKKIHRNRGSVKQISMASLAHQIRRYLWGGKKSLTQWKQPQVSLRIPGLISDPCVIKKNPDPCYHHRV